MATFSENQVRHLYVEKALKSAKIVSTDAVGTLAPLADKDKSTLWFGYVNALGTLVASDKIKIANIVSAKATASGKMAKGLDRYKLTLDGTVNGGAPIANQDYILRLAFRQYVGISDEDQYWKYGMVHAMKGMKADTFYKELALSLAKNLSREAVALVKVYVHSKSKGASYSNSKFGNKFVSGFMEVTPLMKDNGESTEVNPYVVNTSTYVDDIDSIVIEQAEQPWVLGTMEQSFIPFEVQPSTVTLDGAELIWGTVKKEAATNKVENGKLIADLEYFCMGERGDLYRGVGFPNIIKTNYLVDPTKKYDVLDIVYFYAGDNEDVQKSQKTLTIVVEDDGSHTLAKALIARINTVSGLNIENPA